MRLFVRVFVQTLRAVVQELRDELANARDELHSTSKTHHLQSKQLCDQYEASMRAAEESSANRLREAEVRWEREKQELVEGLAAAK